MKMTKNTNKTTSPKTVAELTAQLKWRLAKQPTLDDVTTMLDKGIIEKDEARQILFSKEVKDETSDREAALKEQIKFLEGVVDKLSSNRGTTTITTWPPTYTFTANYPTKYWITGGSVGNSIYRINANSNTVALGSLTSGVGSATTGMNNLKLS